MHHRRGPSNPFIQTEYTYVRLFSYSIGWLRESVLINLLIYTNRNETYMKGKGNCVKRVLDHARSVIEENKYRDEDVQFYNL